MDHLHQRNHLDDLNYQIIASLYDRLKYTTLVKKVIWLGREACCCLIEGFDRDDILPEMNRKLTKRPGNNKMTHTFTTIKIFARVKREAERRCGSLLASGVRGQGLKPGFRLFNFRDLAYPASKL